MNTYEERESLQAEQESKYAEDKAEAYRAQDEKELSDINPE